MQVQKVQNNNNYNPNFGILKIRNAKSWNEEILYEFVTNKEVQKFVRIMHNMGQDIQAGFYKYQLPKSDKIKLSGTNDFVNPPFYEISPNKLNVFSAKEALASYNGEVIVKKEQKSSGKSIKESLAIVDNFNKSLESKQTEQTAVTVNKKEKTAKWWKIWK